VFFSSAPEITVHQTPIGRETLAAISQEIASAAPASRRPPIDTVRYEERPRQPRNSPLTSSPELITITETAIGRATQAAIDEELLAENIAADRSVKQPSRVARTSRSTIFELSIFVVEGDEISIDTPQDKRRAFVEQNVLHRTPACSMSDIVRIDVTRATLPKTVIVRVWSKVERPNR